MVPVAEIIGYAAGILIAITMIPQIIVSLKTKNVKGLSTLMLTIFFLIENSDNYNTFCPEFSNG